MFKSIFPTVLLQKDLEIQQHSTFACSRHNSLRSGQCHLNMTSESPKDSPHQEIPSQKKFTRIDNTSLDWYLLLAAKWTSISSMLTLLATGSDPHLFFLFSQFSTISTFRDPNGCFFTCSRVPPFIVNDDTFYNFFTSSFILVMKDHYLSILNL